MGFGAQRDVERCSRAGARVEVLRGVRARGRGSPVFLHQRPAVQPDQGEDFFFQMRTLVGAQLIVWGRSRRRSTRCTGRSTRARRRSSSRTLSSPQVRAHAPYPFLSLATHARARTARLDSCDVNVSPDKRTILLHSEANLIEALKVRLPACLPRLSLLPPSSSLPTSLSFSSLLFSVAPFGGVFVWFVWFVY